LIFHFDKLNTKVDRWLKEVKNLKTKTMREKVKSCTYFIFVSPILYIKNKPLPTTLGYLSSVLLFVLGFYFIDITTQSYQNKNKLNRSIASTKPDPRE